MFDLGKVNAEWAGRTNKVDVTFDDSWEKDQTAIHYGALFTEWVQQKRAELPHLIPLVILLKTLIGMHGLNVPYYGTDSHGKI